jgi:uncharacterized protein YqjF (DUF2071 family)
MTTKPIKSTGNAIANQNAPKVYLSMILGANFSSGLGPQIPLNVSLLSRFGGHVTTKKGTTWLFANEKGAHPNIWGTALA